MGGDQKQGNQAIVRGGDKNIAQMVPVVGQLQIFHGQVRTSSTGTIFGFDTVHPSVDVHLAILELYRRSIPRVLPVLAEVLGSANRILPAPAVFDR